MSLFKILFPTQVKSMAKLKESLEDTLTRENVLKVQLEQALKKSSPQNMENIMRVSLGLPYINFHNLEDDGKGNDNPPHYLKGFNPEQRAAYIAELAQIFRKPQFQEVLNYHINVLGNHSLQKAPENKMESGRIGIISLRGFRKEFEEADAEYMEKAKEEEEIDVHEVL